MGDSDGCFWCTICYSTRILPFHVAFRPGGTIYEQVVYAATQVMTAASRTQELTKRFRSVCALDLVNLEVEQGAVYALVGPNGAGKTTGIKILMNLIGATSGEAEVLGTDSKQIRGKAHTQIGY